MASTNFAALTTEEKTVWDMRIVTNARNQSIWMRFSGSGENDICKEVFDFRDTGPDTGIRGVITNVTDLGGAGVAGDRTLENREERMMQSDLVLQVDRLRHGVRNRGVVADQRSIVRFREQGVDKLSYWLADMYDQLAFLTLSGISYALNTDGSMREGDDVGVTELTFASDVTAPTANRHYRWVPSNDANGRQVSGQLMSADVGEMRNIDTFSYQAVIHLLELAQTEYIPSISMTDGMPTGWVCFVSPGGLADLRRDPDYKESRDQAMERSASMNPIFRGAEVLMVEGVSIYAHRRVFTTRGGRNLTGVEDAGALTGTKWGTNGAMADADRNAAATPAGGLVGFRALFCGASVLAKGRVSGGPGGDTMIREEDFDYGDKYGLRIGAFFGFRKMRFVNRPYRTTTEDYVIACDFIHGSQI